MKEYLIVQYQVISYGAIGNNAS